MRRLTATEASRRFSDMLDAVEAGEIVEITRNGRLVAKLEPARRTATWGELMQFLRENPPDPDFADDIRKARALLYPGEPPWQD